MTDCKGDKLSWFPKYKPKYITEIPQCTPSFEDISKQMRINADIIIKEITEHVNKEIERMKSETR